MLKTNINNAREATIISERLLQHLKYSMGKKISNASMEDIFN